MNEVLERWNALDAGEAGKEILPCCGATTWATEMTGRRPFEDEAEILIVSDMVWRGLGTADWLEAFKSHPKIGESHASATGGERAKTWSEHEQKDVAVAQDDVKKGLAAGNEAYEKKFGFIFIVCATGKTGPEILEILNRRLQNDRELELREAAEEQRQITQLRLKKWLGL